jgi:hypothetical protein
MNQEASAWYQAVAFPQKLVPLTWEELRVFEVRNDQVVWIDPGRQLLSSPRVRLT